MNSLVVMLKHSRIVPFVDEQSQKEKDTEAEAEDMHIREKQPIEMHADSIGR